MMGAEFSSSSTRKGLVLHPGPGGLKERLDGRFENVDESSWIGTRASLDAFLFFDDDATGVETRA
jgi:hypothetical protein